jgi:tryptophanyl-tRNA synthetase
MTDMPVTGSSDRPRLLSGMQPTADSLHLGNYLGALAQWIKLQDDFEAHYFVADLHALTVRPDPAVVRQRTRITAAQFLAAGVDPERSVLFVQSHVPEHAQLSWLMECTAAYGELRRMTQFKEKGDRAEFTSAALLTYPALQAADVLLYDTDRVPVGDDQRQHIELARDVAERFNSRYGTTFVVPAHAIPLVGARIMDLQVPTRKMSKSVDSPQGTILVLDPPEVITKKLKRAVTDTDGEVRYDPATKPGVANLLSILAAVTGGDPEALAAGYEQYGPLKADTAEALVEALRPLQERFRALAGDPAEVDRIIGKGAVKAQALAAPTLARAMTAIGLLPRP